MSTNIIRYIEYESKNIAGSVYNKNEISKIGHLKEGDITLCYNSKNNYYFVYSIINNNITYMTLPQPTDMDELLNFNPDISLRFSSYDEMPITNIAPKIGDIYKYYDGGTKYAKIVNVTDDENIFEEIDENDVTSSWHQIKWYDSKGKEYNYISTGYSNFLKNLLSNYSDKQYNIANYGLPKDTSINVDDDLYGITYCYLKDIEGAFYYELGKYKENIVNNPGEINDKLDYIIKNLFLDSKDRSQYIEKEYDNDDDDDLFDLITASDELVRILTIIDLFDGHINFNNVRIIYAMG